MSHAPLGVFDIPLVAGNDVNMDMKNTLPGRRPDIHPDVVAVGLELRIQQPALLGDQPHAGVDLFRRQVEKARDMPLRDDQGMARTDRIGVTGAVCELMYQ